MDVPRPGHNHDLSRPSYIRVDGRLPENSQNSFHFLSPEESILAVSHINIDHGDGGAPSPFHPRTSILKHSLDPKLYALCIFFFFLLNIVSTALSYFLPIILQSGMVSILTMQYYYPSYPITTQLSSPPFILPCRQISNSWVSSLHRCNVL